MLFVDRPFELLSDYKRHTAYKIKLLPRKLYSIQWLEREKIAARSMNDKAYNKLILAMQYELAFEVVEDTTTLVCYARYSAARNTSPLFF